MANSLKVLLLPEETYQYLIHVFASHTQSGMPPDEVFPAADLFTRIQRAQTVDFTKLGHAEIEKLEANGLSLSLVPEENPALPPNDKVKNDS
jgi:hypothetical protein